MFLQAGKIGAAELNETFSTAIEEGNLKIIKVLLEDKRVQP
jgi:hypothetical protein